MEYLCLTFLTFILGAIGVLFFLYHKAHFWKRTGIPHLKPILGIGNTGPLFFQTKSSPQYIADMYSEFPEAKYFGIMDINTPILILRDPELIKETCVKNFEHFLNHENVIDEEVDPVVGKNVLALKGERWKEMRNILSPSFTAAKMKFMFELIEKCAENFVQYFLEHPEEMNLIDSKDAFSRYTTDIIATSAFGICVDSLKDRNNEFYHRGIDAMSFTKGLRAFKFLFLRLCPKLLRSIKEPFLSRSTDRFFKRIIQETVKIRDEKKIIRSDMISLLMEARDKKNGIQLTTDDITAQAIIFFLAGFETTSTAMCFVAHELAMNTQVQEKLRNEVDAVMESEDGKISYETLSQMKYLDMVISESLRKYPPAPSTDRRCTKKYTLPSATPGRPKYTVDTDTVIWIPIQGLHHDPKYFPDPEKFDPERFSDENKDNIHPYSYVPFGIGPRMCIASRFALMETKILFVYILRKFILKKSEKTVHPVKFKKGFVVASEGGSWIKFTKRNN